ncbi:MAG: hypothetical protein AB7I19_13895 [Planctomycetota bacterium]
MSISLNRAFSDATVRRVVVLFLLLLLAAALTIAPVAFVFHLESIVQVMRET